MSGEYYSKDETVTNFYKEYSNASPKSPRSLPNTKKDATEPQIQSHRLHDIEEQLEMAENRCNNLKDQLDYMKHIYGVKKAPKSRKISNIQPTQKESDEVLSLSSISMASYEGKMFPKRQNSNAIGTDNTGAAVRTINTILNGITDSVNRLSELHVQIGETPRSKQDSPHPAARIKSGSAAKGDKDLTAELAMNAGNDNVINKKSRMSRKRAKEPKAVPKKPVSHQSLKRATKAEGRSKVSRTSIMEKIPSNLHKRRLVNYGSARAPRSQPTKLVEIYHNIAAKQSDSDETNFNKCQKMATQTRGSQRQVEHTNDDNIPPLNIQVKQDDRGNEDDDDDAVKNAANIPDESPRQEFYDPPEAPRTMSCYSKNYELPTIASKMKQVAKCYLNTFNFKAIPFCAAISTSPSHNIGINIQQVMNIIKNRQPVNGISPTLAHNIGLAAERLNSRPLSALISTINSKTCYRPSQCPLSKSLVNYHQLQDMAKSIPEETAEEVEEDEVDSPEVRTMVITGPSGDMEVKNRNVPVWAVGQAECDECTCANRPGVDFQHVMNKYRSIATPNPTNTNVSQREKRWQKYGRLNTKKYATKPSHASVTNGYGVPNYTAPSIQQESSEETHLQGKEKNLKEVLTNLHNDFEALNKRYEDLSEKATSDDEGTLKELEVLENELNKKEEEITMVMTLYKEVLALKQQVKTLKQKTSQASVAPETRDVSGTFNEYNNPQAAFHLTKLLRQIQVYQMRYKKDGVGV